MNRFDALKRWTWSIFAVCLAAFALAGCEGDDGAPGADGADGADGLSCWDLNGDGVPNLPEEDTNGDGVVDVNDCRDIGGGGNELVQQAKVESCDTCHGGVGEGHQALYDPYNTDGNLLLTLDNLSSAAGAGGGFDVTLDFSITQDGAPFVDADGLPSIDSKSFYIVEYDSTTGDFPQQFGGFPSMDNSLIVSNGDGSYTLTQNFAVDPTALAGGAIVGSIKEGEIEIADTTAYPGRVTMYENISSDAFPIGDIATFESAANVEGCQACHSGFLEDGVTKGPYRKHGNIEAVVANVPNFVQCKACHSVDAAGGHPEWQYMVDDPLNWATAALPAAEVTDKYAYDRTLMNDVHMSHAMELPYPMSMANCTTCHEGKFDTILADEQFVVETCKSCHPVEGNGAWPEDVGATLEGDYAQSHRAPPLAYIWAKEGVESLHTPDADCQLCHVAGTGFPVFSDLHTGYDPTIYDADGNRYADTLTATIDSVTVSGTDVTVAWSVADPEMEAYVLVSLYGWNSKNFIVPSHARDGSDLCVGRSGDPDGCEFEYEYEDNPLFKDFSEIAPGSWEVTADLAAWVPVGTNTPDIPTMIADGTISRAEITLTPRWTDADGNRVALNAVTQTFEVGTGTLVDNYFKGDNAVVDVEKCNACHDQLASTFHAGSGRGGDIVACRNCHNPTFDGSHLEMNSRSTENYVHSIHSFQDFDLDRDKFGEAFDPVYAARYNQHINHIFPTFTITNCEACHVAGTYNVPDQSATMPGVLSESYGDQLTTWYEMIDAPEGSIPAEIASAVASRNIGAIAPHVTGPASRACGGCHRATSIKNDDPGSLAAFNSHTEAFGTYVENGPIEEAGDEDGVLFGVIFKIMSMFE
jgi:OmcA/MtrC family decaheme c-type cytochrome